ncbi:putative pre-mRNA-splicing factor ATP-dependent RNA helicase DHX32 isoform X3 [Syngnathus acus]|uniref:putative pre-mRNA-splicing factor ATP-dependent RNA helicase DHX32 isoform X3 n=1 Tax=Syngnathus acus TaxID=161584 RepID=UPI001885AE1F|nr:putative pre-mRNA-splicing factor ATP-dependent RNA helicase DHX32 isoform X3 [Syngnathus acus]
MSDDAKSKHQSACESEGACVLGSFCFGDELELNRFDGLPFSSRYYKLLAERRTLPVWTLRRRLEDALVHAQIVLVCAHADAGRSTQIPQWCAELCLSAGYRYGTVVCTQHVEQRVVDLALRVADEMDVAVGHEVGYQMGRETCCCSDTVLRYCTDDILLREMMSDPFLEHYAVIVIDQAHQRTVSTDLLLGLLKDIVAQRPELRVVVLAAPPLTDSLRNHFRRAPTLSLESPLSGQLKVVWSRGGKDYFYSALRLVLEIHRTREDGDVVVFLASEEEVNCAHGILQKEGSRLGAHLGQMLPTVLGPGRGGLGPPPDERGPGGITRRVFLATRHAEDAWWAMDSVNFVVDCGVQKKMVYNPRIRANSEVLQSISRCQAELRRRLCGPAGKCFCLYAEDNQLPTQRSPQILESNITATVLFLKRMEIGGLAQCEFIDRPDPESLMQALEELDYLAALDDDGNLSEIGIIMSEIPLEPQLAKALLASCEFDCVSEMLTVAAMLSAPNCFLEPPPGISHEASQCHRKFRHHKGDHFSLINVFNTFKRSQKDPYIRVEEWCRDNFLDYSALRTAESIRAELTNTLNRIELPVSEPAFGSRENAANLKRALLAGFFMQVRRPNSTLPPERSIFKSSGLLKVARDVDGSGNYLILAHKHVAQVHPRSGYGPYLNKLGLPEWVLFHEYTLAQNNCMRIVTEISPQVFTQTAPLYYFYNLPHSESKDILQHMLEPRATRENDKHKASNLTDDSSSSSSNVQSTDRCVIQ